jgi:hypothetical protein
MSNQEIVDLIKDYCARNNIFIPHLNLCSKLEFLDRHYRSEPIKIMINIASNNLHMITTDTEIFRLYHRYKDRQNIVISISKLIQEERTTKITELLNE